MIDQIRNLEKESDIVGYLTQEVDITKIWLAKRMWKYGYVPGAECIKGTDRLLELNVKSITIELAGSPAAGKSSLARIFRKDLRGGVRNVTENFPDALTLSSLVEILQDAGLDTTFSDPTLYGKIKEAFDRLESTVNPLVDLLSLYTAEDGEVDAASIDPFQIEYFKLQGYQNTLHLRDEMIQYDEYLQPMVVERYVVDQMIFKWALLMDGRITIDQFKNLSNDPFNQALSFDDDQHLFILALLIAPPGITIDRREKIGKDGKFVRSAFVEKLFWLYLTLHRWMITTKSLPDNFIYMGLDSTKKFAYISDYFYKCLIPIISLLYRGEESNEP